MTIDGDSGGWCWFGDVTRQNRRPLRRRFNGLESCLHKAPQNARLVGFAGSQVTRFNPSVVAVSGEGYFLVSNVIDQGFLVWRVLSHEYQSRQI